MKKMLGVMIVLFAVCFVMPAKAQSAAGAVIKTTTKAAREKIKEVTQGKSENAAPAATASKGTTTSRTWGTKPTAAANGKGDNRGQVIIPVRPIQVEDQSRRAGHVDTSLVIPW